MVTVSTKSDLIALHKALLQAKFCDDPWDYDVPAAPQLARLSRQDVNQLRKLDSQGNNAEQKSESWASWIVMTPERREWEIALRFARTRDWNKFSAPK